MRVSDPGAPARHGHGARHALARVPDAARRQLRARRIQAGPAGLRHRRAAPGEKAVPEIMANLAVVAGSYFNGERHFSRGPYTLAVNDGIVTDIAQGDCSEALARCGAQVARAAFAMPGLVDSHCHLFLDGSLLDLAARAR